jgi:hypothetical protein
MSIIRWFGFVARDAILSVFFLGGSLFLGYIITPIFYGAPLQISVIEDPLVLEHVFIGKWHGHSVDGKADAFDVVFLNDGGGIWNEKGMRWSFGSTGELFVFVESTDGVYLGHPMVRLVFDLNTKKVMVYNALGVYDQYLVKDTSIEYEVRQNDVMAVMKKEQAECIMWGDCVQDFAKNKTIILALVDTKKVRHKAMGIHQKNWDWQTRVADK